MSKFIDKGCELMLSHNLTKPVVSFPVYEVIAVAIILTCVSSAHQDIRGLDKEMRAWDAFTGLDSLVKNMVTSLRAVGELQNPAIRDRHWEQLMQATQVCVFVCVCVCL